MAGSYWKWRAELFKYAISHLRGKRFGGVAFWIFYTIFYPLNRFGRIMYWYAPKWLEKLVKFDRNKWSRGEPYWKKLEREENERMWGHHH